jgi:hypothetical protein
MTFSSFRKTLTATGPTCDDMHMFKLNEFDSRIKGNLLNIKATALINRTGLIIFGVLNREI